jgi:FKBP-type peptidyl-prolyl cis-trans isomerase FkpA
MKLKLLKRFLWIVAITVVVASCITDEIDDYVPPTLEDELSTLNEYIDTLEARGLNVQETEMGVYYVLDSIGVGEYPVDGDTCTVKYTGFFLSGEIFDSSEDNTFEVKLGEQSVITGWEDGLKVFKKNAQGYLIIPSEFAYGSNGYGSIPPYTTLIFNIEMVDIKQGY